MNILLFDSLCPSSPPLAFSPLVSRINLRAVDYEDGNNSDHVIIIFSRFVTTICMRGYTRLDRLPLGWMEFPQRCDVSAVGPRLGNSWEMSVVNWALRCARKAPTFSSQYDAWPRPPKVFFFIILPVHGFIYVNFSCTEPVKREHPQTKPFMFVLVSAPDPKRRPDVVPADTAHFPLA